jgi:hypothetical protein
VIFNHKPEHFIGKTFADILVPPKDCPSFLNSFFAMIDSAMSWLRTQVFEAEASLLRSNQSILCFLTTLVSTTGEVQETLTNSEEISILICSIKDRTSMIASRCLLKEGREKGEHLLSMIPGFFAKKL